MIDREIGVVVSDSIEKAHLFKGKVQGIVRIRVEIPKGVVEVEEEMGILHDEGIKNYKLQITCIPMISS
jgi:hypothetical protein